jgi:hypothetical protein
VDTIEPELSYASSGRIRRTSRETSLELGLTRQRGPILGWRLCFASCFNELTYKPDVHSKICTSPCRSLSPPNQYHLSLQMAAEEGQFTGLR